MESGGTGGESYGVREGGDNLVGWSWKCPLLLLKRVDTTEFPQS